METRKAFKYVDATPDENYPLRILQAYRDDCDVLWSSTSLFEDVEENNPVMDALNNMQKARAKILDKAIAKLKG
jgi:hypothetical protein